MSKQPEIAFSPPLTAPRRPAGRVILFGEVLIDAFPDRLVPGGAPFNVARHLRAFGLHPVLISRTGNDPPRDLLLAAMARFGMDTVGIQCDPIRPTGRVQVRVGPGGHRFEILPNQAYDFIHPAVTRMVALSAQADLVYFGTLAQRGKISRSALATLLRSNAAPRMLDLNLRAPWYDPPTLERSLSHANLVKVNAEELASLAGILRLPPGGERATAGALLRQYALECLLVTRGERGAWLLDKDGSETEVGGIAGQAVVDTVGAGDAFSAVFIAGALHGWPPRQTLARANAFAAALCGLRGAVPEDAAFYRPFLLEWGLAQEPGIRPRG